MRAAGRLGSFRAHAKSLMTDTFTATAPTGATTTNADGFQVPVFEAKGTTLGKVSGSSAQTRDTNTRMVTVGNVSRPVVSGGLHIPLTALVPVASEDERFAWVYEVTALGPTSDAALLGRRYMVVDAPAKSLATARRLDVVEIS